MSALDGYTGGYPFLQIARGYGVDYGAVLKFADKMENNQVGNDPLWHNVKLRADVFIANTHLRMVRAGEIESYIPYESLWVYKNVKVPI